MLASVSEVLAQENLSIESVTTELHRHNHKKNGPTDFSVHANCVTTTHLDAEGVQKLVHKLEGLKESLQLHTLDIRVQRVAKKSD